jgi:Mce-associated membrane protein
VPVTNPEPPEVATLDAPAPVPDPHAPAEAVWAAPNLPAPVDPAPRGRRPALLPALILVLVAGLATAVVQTVRLSHEHDLAQARRQAIAAASNYATDITTYDFSHLDAQFKKVQDESTGSFRSQYTEASAGLRDLIAKFKATASGKVLEIAVESSDTGHAQILLFVDQTVSNTNSTTPRVDRSRMKMGLEKQNGKWLISSLDLL